MILKPNPNCDDRYCQNRQQEFKLKPKVEIKEEISLESDMPLHEENEWGIELVSESNPENKTTTTDSLIAGSSGLKLAYEPAESSNESVVNEQVVDGGEASLEELMAQMKSM